MIGTSMNSFLHAMWRWINWMHPGPQPQPQPPPVLSPPSAPPVTAGGWTMLVCEPYGTILTVRENGTRTVLPIQGQSASWSLATGGVIFAAAGRIFLAGADGFISRRVGDVTDAVMPQQARNGLIVFMGAHGGIYLIEGDGSGLRELLPASTNQPGAPQYMQPYLAPSGTWVAYVKQTDSPYQRQVWRINVDGSGNKQLTSGPDSANAPVISPDEAFVYCFSGQESPQLPTPVPPSIYSQGQRDIDVVPASGGLRRMLTTTYPVLTQAELERLPDGTFIMADNPSPSPDGRSVIFDGQVWRASERIPRPVTGIVNIDGTGQRIYHPFERGVVRVALR